MRRELGDLFTEPLQRRDVFGSGNDFRRLNLHDAFQRL